MIYKYENLQHEYELLWDSLEIKENRKSQIYRDAKKIIANKDKYQEIEKATGVPWFFIGVIHLRESNCDFSTHLHNGDSLNRRTHNVPAGRPIKGNPPFTFLESAVDALKQKGFEKVTDWSYPHMAFLLETYNGFGYRYRNLPSAYLWSGSNHYVAGKYVSDGIFDRNEVDVQPGVMCVLKAIEDITQPIALPELRKISRRVGILSWFKNFFGWFVGVFSGVGVLDGIGVGKEYLDWIKQFGFTGGIALVVLIAIIGWFVLKYHEKASLREQEEGRYKPSGGPQ